jgi:5,10-methylenetetrahydromethanopterin reductase
VKRAPEDERHLVVHKGHLRYLNEADEAAWGAGAHTLLRGLTISGTAEEVRSKVESFAEQGVTELVYGPMTDVERELRAMADAVGVSA